MMSKDQEGEKTPPPVEGLRRSRRLQDRPYRNQNADGKAPAAWGSESSRGTLTEQQQFLWALGLAPIRGGEKKGRLEAPPPVEGVRRSRRLQNRPSSNLNAEAPGESGGYTRVRSWRKPRKRVLRKEDDSLQKPATEGDDVVQSMVPGQSRPVSTPIETIGEASKENVPVKVKGQEEGSLSFPTVGKAAAAGRSESESGSASEISSSKTCGGGDARPCLFIENSLENCSSNLIEKKKSGGESKSKSQKLPQPSNERMGRSIPVPSVSTIRPGQASKSRGMNRFTEQQPHLHSQRGGVSVSPAGGRSMDSGSQGVAEQPPQQPPLHSQSQPETAGTVQPQPGYGMVHNGAGYQPPPAPHLKTTEQQPPLLHSQRGGVSVSPAGGRSMDTGSQDVAEQPPQQPPLHSQSQPGTAGTVQPQSGNGMVHNGAGHQPPPAPHLNTTEQQPPLLHSQRGGVSVSLAGGGRTPDLRMDTDTGFRGVAGQPLQQQPPLHSQAQPGTAGTVQPQHGNGMVHNGTGYQPPPAPHLNTTEQQPPLLHSQRGGVSVSPAGGGRTPDLRVGTGSRGGVAGQPLQQPPLHSQPGTAGTVQPQHGYGMVHNGAGYHPPPPNHQFWQGATMPQYPLQGQFRGYQPAPVNAGQGGWSSQQTGYGMVHNGAAYQLPPAPHPQNWQGSVYNVPQSPYQGQFMGYQPAHANPGQGGWSSQQHGYHSSITVFGGTVHVHVPGNYYGSPQRPLYGTGHQYPQMGYDAYPLAPTPPPQHYSPMLPSGPIYPPNQGWYGAPTWSHNY